MGVGVGGGCLFAQLQFCRISARDLDFVWSSRNCNIIVQGMSCAFARDETSSLSYLIPVTPFML